MGISRLPGSEIPATPAPSAGCCISGVGRSFPEPVATTRRINRRAGKSLRRNFVEFKPRHTTSSAAAAPRPVVTWPETVVWGSPILPAARFPSPAQGRATIRRRGTFSRACAQPARPRLGSARLHPSLGVKSSYSMTSLARARIDCGIVRPSILAVFRLTTSSKAVGCWTGKSAGLAPWSILPA